MTVDADACRAASQFAAHQSMAAGAPESASAAMSAEKRQRASRIDRKSNTWVSVHRAGVNDTMSGAGTVALKLAQVGLPGLTVCAADVTPRDAHADNADWLSAEK